MEADLEGATRRVRRLDGDEGGGQVERDRLLAEDVLACRCRTFDHLDVQRRRRRDHDPVDVGIGEEVVVARRPLDAQPLPGRAGALLVRVDDSNELGGPDRAGEVLGVHQADASEAGDAQADPAEPDSPLARGFAAHPSGLATFS